MIFWLLLKFFPTFASLVQAPTEVRYAVYAVLGITISLAIFTNLELKRISLKPTIIGWIALILFLGSFLPNAIDTLAAPSLVETLPTIRGIFLFLSLSLIIQRVQSPRTLLWAYFAVISAVQLTCLLLGWEGISSQLASGSTDVDAGRVQGIFSNPWTATYFGVCYLGVCLMMVCRTKNLALKALCASFGLTGIAIATLTISRAAVVMIPCVLLGWIAEYCLGRDSEGARRPLLKRTQAVAGAIFVLTAGVIATCTLFPDVVNYYTGLWFHRITSLDMSESERLSSIHAGLGMFLENPLSGVGWDMVPYHALKYGGVFEGSAHNLLVDAAAQGGILGLLFGGVLEFGIPFSLIRRTRTVPGVFVFGGTWLALILSQAVVSPLMLESHWDVFCYWIIHVAAFRELRLEARDKEAFKIRCRIGTVVGARAETTETSRPRCARETLTK